MIALIQGNLDHIQGSTALITPQNSGLSYHVLLPTFTAARIANDINKPIKLHTYYYLESQGQGSTMYPRLVGFLNINDLSFYELFTTCKGIGNRKALKSMAISCGQIANAIQDRDAKLLQSLPEIGKRTAETIIATLHGKVDRFIAPDESNPASTADNNSPQATTRSSITNEAIDILTQLGEPRLIATQLVEKALQKSKTKPESTQNLIEMVYAIKDTN